MKSILLIILFASQIVFAQTTVLSEPGDVGFDKENFGPNRTWHMAFRFSYGQTVSDINLPEGFNYSWFRSSFIGTGFDYKIRILRRFSFVGFSDYTLSTIAGNNEDTESNLRYRVNTISLGVGPRINFGKTGNTLGKYLEAGVFAGFIINANSRLKGEIDGELTSITQHNTSIIDQVPYGFYGRLGLNGFSFFYQYRITDTFTQSDNWHQAGVILTIVRH